ncbi:MAG: 3-methyl-2-oxobutanoate hydroxymethyltransferase [Candidatus Gastranaerophilales bacterium]|nr:3-methyl-2-oxobutanoate hydroxymethyltransferase [Candidatus Gastranaerophilales bacterium]
MQHITSETLIQMKKAQQKIVCITAYDYSTAKIIDKSGIDLILVGDSAAMVMMGYKDTCQIGMDEMLIFTKGVANGVENALLIADMPAGTYETSLEAGIKNAKAFIEAGAKGVKLETCNEHILNLVRELKNLNIPVVAHLGFTPQHVDKLGGYKVQVKEFAQAQDVLAQAKQLEEAGAIALVLEMVPEIPAKYISENLTVPTIGIGAGQYCDGQILVVDDLLGKFSDFTPKFVKKYADLNEVISQAVSSYSQDVKKGKFPEDVHKFNITEEEKEKFSNARM